MVYRFKMDLNAMRVLTITMTEGQVRYQRLLDTIDELKNTKLNYRSIEWYDKHTEFLTEIRQKFDDLTYIHPEILDPEFRGKCKVNEAIINQLLRDYDTHRWFGLYDYNRFCNNLLFIVEVVFNTKDELSDLFSNIKL